jgi:hypothetical protein
LIEQKMLALGFDEVSIDPWGTSWEGSATAQKRSCLTRTSTRWT